MSLDRRTTALLINTFYGIVEKYSIPIERFRCSDCDDIDYFKLDSIFLVSDPKIGSRLGINYVRSTRDSVEIIIPSISSDKDSDSLRQFITISQCSVGLLAISAVVWDAGLYLADFLFHYFSSTSKCNDEKVSGLSSPPLFSLGSRVIDLGCGTGIVGICALLCGAEYVLFTDGCNTLAESNINSLPNHENYAGKYSFLEYEWSASLQGFVPPEFLLQSSSESNPSSQKWDTVLCSDILYESKSHSALLKLLESIPFRQAVFAYKKRHAIEEEAFFQSLSSWCHLHVVDPSLIGLRLVNISHEELSELYIIIATPK